KSGFPERREVRDRRLRSWQNHEVGVARQCRAWSDLDEFDGRFGLKRIEVVEIGDVRQDRHRDAYARACFAGKARSSANGSRAGRGRAWGNNGTRPRGCHPVACAIAFMPEANNAGSPRNLLTRKPHTRAASSGSITALVPTRLAITPPRSMSPMSTTG